MNHHEQTVLKEIQKRKSLLLDPPTYAVLKKATGLVNESAIAYILTKFENNGLIERIGKGARNIQITEKGMQA